jgi:hypothetical protein
MSPKEQIRNAYACESLKSILSLVLCLAALSSLGCAMQGSNGSVDPAGSISSVVKAKQHGLEVAATTEDQAREAVLTTPTVFNVAFEDDVYSWERARFFLENYVGAASGHSSAVTKVVGSRWSLESNPGLEGYQYQVAKDLVDGGFTYRITCVPSGSGEPSQAALNAGNLARFIRDGKLEISLLQQR